MDVTILGTSCMVPTKERNTAGVFLSYKSDGILFDCGEGTQRQMNNAGIKRTKVNKILITHWHGDHVAGLIGLIQTLGNEDEVSIVDLCGPKGTKSFIENLLKSCVFDMKVKLKVNELDIKKQTIFFENEDYQLIASLMKHRVVCIGYSFVEKDKRNINTTYLKKHGVKDGPHLKELQNGKDIIWKGKNISANDATTIKKGRKFTYIMDTLPCSNAIELAENSDILVMESVYSSKLQEKAEEYMHMTAKDAALIANQANVKKLILTHFSQRYKTTQEIEEDAKDYFDNVSCAYDFMKVNM